MASLDFLKNHKYTIFRYILFILLCFAFSAFLMFRTFSYDGDNQAIMIGARLWSDFGAHIPMIRSFSMGGNFDRIMYFRLPEYPIFPGEPIRFHFLFYMIVGLLEKIGFRIDWALNIPSIIGFSGLLIFIGIISYKLFNNVSISLLSVLLFLFNGTLSFIPFFRTYPLSLETPWQILTAMQFPAFGPWDNGLVSAFWNLNIYTNQRHLAAGFALGLGYIMLLLFLEKKSWKNQVPFLFISVLSLSILPYFHQPMLLIIGLFCIWYFLVFPRLRLFLMLTGVLSFVPILFQLQTLASDTSAFTWYPGYLIHGSFTLPSVFTYWFHNLGLHLILVPIGFAIAPFKVKKVTFPMFSLFLIANLFKFSVEIAANHKFFNFFMIFGNMLSAYVIFEIYSLHGRTRWGPTVERPQPRNLLTKSFYNLQKLFMWSRNIPKHQDIERGEDVGRGKTRTTHQIIKICITALFIFFLTLSGVIDFFVVLNDRKIPIQDIPRNEIATWIATNTPKDALFLNSSYLYHPASIAGRTIFLGWPYFPWSAGYRENRMPIMNKMYESKDPNLFCPLLKKYNISYVTVEPVSNDPDLPNIDPAYFRSIADPLFFAKNSQYEIYLTHSLCDIYDAP